MNLQILNSSLMFVSGRCTPLDKPTKRLVICLSNFGYPNNNTSGAPDVWMKQQLRS